jgi:hypothetical protein
MKKSFRDDFNDAWARIESGIPFAHARYADGEIALSMGKGVGRGSQATDIDGWQAPSQHTKLGKEILESLYHTEPNYYYAISCDTPLYHTDPNYHSISSVIPSISDKNYLLSHIKQDKKYITFANLWINGNYNMFLEKIKSHRRPTIIIGNQNGENAKFPFEIENYLSFGNNCVETWEKYSDEIKNILADGFGKISDRTVFISVGPMSEAIIHNLWKINPTNQYVDVGSALDEYVHGRKTRPYMISGSFYNTQICEMEL